MSPGEVTLADQGVLFLDELPEFGRDVLEALREPLEEGRVAIARVGRATTFPARFQLVAAMNLCPCGHAGGEPGQCRCPEGVVARYQGRISGPLRDRIDLWVAMPRVPPVELVGVRRPEPSAVVASRIGAARAIQAARQGGLLNGRLRGRHLRRVCGLGPTERARAVALAELDSYSARGTERLLRVARTIADLGGSDRVAVADLDEAARYRTSASRAARALAS
jgi:magnesium chelatase family protein